MTVDEFLKWDSDDGRRYELVDGEPRAMAPASTIHGFLQNELGRLVGNHLRDKASGCEVVANPGIVPRLLSEHNIRIPDLAVTCSASHTPRSGSVDRDPFPQQPGEDLDQCLGLHEHPERSRNLGFARGSDCGRIASAFAAGRAAGSPDSDHRGRPRA
ncbi:MAG TPA: Uma2 family endonuclease [Stellaceae bacterium]|nr:Uma2 family endonuclease [Stellaceae bacterium]